MSNTSDAVEAFKPIRELASRVVVSSRAYSDIINDLGDPSADFECRKKALGLSLSIAPVMIIALENIQEFKKHLDKAYQPPIAAIMLLGAIASSCQMIAVSTPGEDMEEVPLLDLVTLQRILEAPVVSNWMFTCLGQSH